MTFLYSYKANKTSELGLTCCIAIFITQRSPPPPPVVHHGESDFFNGGALDEKYKKFQGGHIDPLDDQNPGFDDFFGILGWF